MTTLDLYKKVKESNGLRPWEIADSFIVFNSLDFFVENPTDEEYMVIDDVCQRAYMKAEEVSLVQIADKISELYSKKEISLQKLLNKSAWDILDLIS